MHNSQLICHGIDILELDEFSKIYNSFPTQFLKAYFTSHEVSQLKIDTHTIEKLASRFAVKEAVLKALGTGWGGGVSFKDVEVLTENSGALSITLYRKLESVSLNKGILNWHISTSHTKNIVMASVIGSHT
ncbi:holo-ACP synthase [Acinetobacter junii]|uniref:holo-ACP synthase n=1 Tax=Acinetobacter junii TaxID=40215 RepID=UPI0030A81933